MTTRSPSLPAAVALACVLALGACKKQGGDQAAAPAGDLDTTNSAAVDGMSDEQLKAQAKAVSPEQARAMGISDSATMPGSGQEVSDSTASPASRPEIAGTATADSASAAAPAMPAKPGARRDRQ